MRRKSAGFRTNILIAAGSCIFTLAALGFGTGDPTRVPGQIVTGIGFLGAGAILHSSERVHGMTTAAMIWVNAALGTASGAGEFRLALFGAATDARRSAHPRPARAQPRIEGRLRTYRLIGRGGRGGGSTGAPACPRRSRPA